MLSAWYSLELHHTAPSLCPPSPHPQTMAALAGRQLDSAALEAGLQAVQQDVQISANAPGGARTAAVPAACHGCASFCRRLPGTRPEPCSLCAQSSWEGLAFPTCPLSPLHPCLAGGMVEFRRSLAASFLFKGLLFAAQQLEAEGAPAFQSPFPESYRSGEGSGRVFGGWFLGSREG